MDVVNKNLKYLRSIKNLTQSGFAELLGVKRASIGAYEEGRAKPNHRTLEAISKLYNISIDTVLKVDLCQQAINNLKKGTFFPNGSLKVLAITVDEKERENIHLVPIKARAGYLGGYEDPEFLIELPKFNLPFLTDGTYRAFEIEGDSMLPLPPGSIVVGEFVEDWMNLKSGDTYVVISKNEGVVYKRVTNNLGIDGTLVMCSDNLSYPVFTIKAEDVQEIWKMKMYIAKESPKHNMSVDRVMGVVLELQQEMLTLRKEVEKNKTKILNKT